MKTIYGEVNVSYNEVTGWSVYLGTAIIKTFGFEEESAEKAYAYASKLAREKEIDN